ncbi:MAG TPA: DUF2931 family protein [Azospira sp.]|nr:DUF2931 family protein [Azospira sp.]
MPDDKFNPRRFFLRLAASTGLSALGAAGSAQAFLGRPGKFEWLPTECADKRYPMQLISGQLLGSDGLIAHVPAGKIINNGWGEIGSRRLEGPEQKAVPERLDLAWFSFSEDKFYGGSVPLPHALLMQLFAEGFEVPLAQERDTWRKIVVGMGLGGWTSVWLAGSGLVREVARARVEPVSLAWSRVIDNPAIDRAEFVRSTLMKRLGKEEFETLIRNGPPVSSWPRYARRERWRVVVAGNAVPQYIFVRGFNGECQFHDFTRSSPGVFEPLPRNVQIACLSPKGSKLLAEIGFDEAEMFGAFDQARSAGTEPLTLRFEMEARSRVAIALESSAGRIALQRSRVQIGSLSK